MAKALSWQPPGTPQRMEIAGLPSVQVTEDASELEWRSGPISDETAEHPASTPTTLKADTKRAAKRAIVLSPPEAADRKPSFSRGHHWAAECTKRLIRLRFSLGRNC